MEQVRPRGGRPRGLRGLGTLAETQNAMRRQASDLEQRARSVPDAGLASQMRRQAELLRFQADSMISAVQAETVAARGGSIAVPRTYAQPGPTTTEAAPAG